MKKLYFILGIVIILLVGGALFAWEKKAQSPAPIVQPPVVTPTTTSKSRQPENPLNPQTPKTPYQKPAGWKTYENQEFGFAFDYPGKFDVGTEGSFTEHGIVKGFGIDFPGTFLDFSIYKDLDITERRIEIENSFKQGSYNNIDGVENIIFYKTMGLKLMAHNNRKSIIVYLLPHPFRKELLFDIRVYNKPYDKIFFSAFRFLP